MKSLSVSVFLMTLLLCAHPLSAQNEIPLQSSNSLYDDSLLDPNSGELIGVGGSSGDFSDHKAEVFDISGNVKIMKKGNQEWYPVTRAMIIEEGDQILTGDMSYVEISYESQFLNIVRIDEKTKAEFRSIEPTDLYLEDGAIFSALDGLKKGSEYKVTTATYVAAVRGTHFDVSYNASTQQFFAATIPVLEDGHESQVEISALTAADKSVPVMLAEGFQLNLEQGQDLSSELVKNISPEVLDRVSNQYETMKENIQYSEKLRQEGQELLKGNPDDLLERSGEDSDKKGLDLPGGGNDGPEMEDAGRNQPDPLNIQVDPDKPIPINDLIEKNPVEPRPMEHPPIPDIFKDVPRPELETARIVEEQIGQIQREHRHEQYQIKEPEQVPKSDQQ